MDRRVRGEMPAGSVERAEDPETAIRHEIPGGDTDGRA